MLLQSAFILACKTSVTIRVPKQTKAFIINPKTKYKHMKQLLIFIVMLLFLPIAGISQWSDNPGENLQITDLPGERAISKVAVSPAGDYYIGYFSQEAGNYNVRLQRLDQDGYILWEENGILVSDHPNMTWLTDWDLTADHDNHAILTWQDIRSGGNNNTVAYRIAPDGSFVWGNNGIMLSNSTDFDVSPKVIVTAANNAVFAWQSESNIILQKISPDGTKQWGEWGITLSSAKDYAWPQLLPAGDDDIILKYYEDSGPFWAPDRDLLAQRFDADGSPVWPQPAVIVDDGSITAWTQILSMKPDGNDGFFISWHDYQLSGTQASAWLQHVNANGQIQFQANGVLLSNLVGNNQFHPALAMSQYDQNIYVFWTETDGDQFFSGISGQKVSPNGSIFWGEGGKVIIPLGTPSITIHEVAATDNDIIVMYDQSSSGTSYNLHAIRLDSNGNFVWDTQSKPISTVNSTKTHTCVSEYANGQWVLSWTGNRTGSPNIFAQNIQPDGSLGIVEGDEFFSITFNITNEAGSQIEDAIVVLNGIENEPGNYVFEEVIPGIYEFSITRFCYDLVTGEIAITNADVVVDTILPGNPGDANGSGMVDVLDVISVVNYFIGLEPESFCFYNADVNGDGIINVADIIAIVNIFQN